MFHVFKPTLDGRRQHPDLILDQNLASLSVLDLPDNILACTKANDAGYADTPAVSHSWRGLVRERN